MSATPDSLDASRIRGVSLGILGDRKGSGQVLAALVRRAPFDSDVRLAAGVVAAQLADTRTAEQDFLAAVRYGPENPVGWQNLAILYRYEGRQSEAASAQQTADRLTAAASAHG